MNWMNIRTETLRSPEFANAPKGAIETWLRVLAYCCEQENGGRMEGAANWTDRAWMTTCGVTKSEVEEAKPLLYDDAVDYFVDGYPEDKEAEVQAKRKAGKTGGKRSAAKRASSTASSTASTEGEGEGNRKENGKEKEIPPIPASAKPTAGDSSDSEPDEPKWKPTEPQIRLGALFRRRPQTRWSAPELKAYRAILPIDEGDVELLERYYKASIPPSTDYRRRDLATLLNNFTGEVDRARNWKPVNVF